MAGVPARHLDRAWLALVVLAIAALHILSFGNALVADDVWFSGALEGRTLAEFIAWRYASWSGRLPIEAALVLVVHHLWVWKLLNGLTWVLLCYSAGRLALASTGKSAAATTALAFVGVMLLSPGTLYSSAFWITGSVNYLWPMALGLYGLLVHVEGERRGNASRWAGLLASGLAMYNEQVAIALLPAAVVILLIRVARRSWRWWDIALVAFMAANAAVVFTAPGSHQRFLAEQALRFPDFGLLDVFDKLAIGLGLIARSVIDPRNMLILAAIAAVSALLLRAPVGRAGKLTMFAGLGFLAIGYVLLLPGMADASLARFYALPPIDGASASSLGFHVLSAWRVFAVACLVAGAAAVLWKSPEESLSVLLTLTLGGASLVALGFSPTAYASGDRIHFVSQIAFLLVVLRLTAEVEREYGPPAFRIGVAVAVLLAVRRIVLLLPF